MRRPLGACNGRRTPGPRDPGPRHPLPGGTMADSPSTRPDPAQERPTEQPPEIRSLPLIAACGCGSGCGCGCQSGSPCQCG
ncbi:hypothetical protein GEV49_21475 [Streptomyces sp. SYP-A7193]|nr:hypothetical protein GEV49_21475 [Streptomyces sp. SYP-A7193]